MDDRLQGPTSRREALKLAGGLAAGGAAAMMAGGSAPGLDAVLAAPKGTATSFRIEFDGVAVPAVQSIDEFETESEVVMYIDGNESVEHFRPGNHKPGKMTVTTDWSNTSEFFSWRKTVLDGKVDRKSVSIVFLNDAGAEMGRINLYECWPSKWTGPALNARNSGHATEALEIVWETMELKAS